MKDRKPIHCSECKRFTVENHVVYCSSLGLRTIYEYWHCSEYEKIIIEPAEGKKMGEDNEEKN